jgi:catechol 2,3-dioxygenase-like lactoylglutathione lyase family enzyme
VAARCFSTQTLIDDDPSPSESHQRPASNPASTAEQDTSARRNAMLGEKDAAATLAVSDLQRARDFYEGKLGLKPVPEPEGAVVYRAGSSTVLVYPSEYAGTNQATAVTWAAGEDFDAIVGDLRSKGVRFEQYDLPGTTRDGDIHVMGELRGVWFKDPDGNILSLIDQAM